MATINQTLYTPPDAPPSDAPPPSTTGNTVVDEMLANPGQPVTDQTGNLITMPLMMAQTILGQPFQPVADRQAYQDTLTQSQLPDFFRQAAAAIAQQQQQSDQAAALAAASGAQANQPEPDLYVSPQQQLEQELAQIQAISAGGGTVPGVTAPAPVAAEAPVAPPPSEGGGGGGLFGEIGGAISGLAEKAKDTATEALAPIGHAAEAGIEAAGRGIQAIPGGEAIGTAVENLPVAAATFKHTFAQDFKQKTGEDLNTWSALKALDTYGLTPIEEKLAQATDEVTGHTIDPVLNNTIGVFSPETARWITAAVDRAGEMAPYVLMGILTGGAADAPTAIEMLPSAVRFLVSDPVMATFTAQTLTQLGGLTQAYQRGQITGGDFLKAAGLQIGQIAGPEAVGKAFGPTVGRYFANLKLNRAVEEAKAGLPEEPIARAVTAAERLAPKDEGAVEATQAAPVAPRAPETGLPAPEPGIVYSNLSPTESEAVARGERVNPVWTTTNPEDVKVQGIPGSQVHAFRINEGAEPIRAAGVKDAAIYRPEDLTPIARIPEEQHFPPDVVERARPISATQPEAAAVGKPVERAAEAAGAGGVGARNEMQWNADTFDKEPRRRIESSPYSEVWQRQDGSFDVVDKRWADMKYGETAGATGGIRNFPTHEDARAAAEEVNAYYAKPPEERLKAFHEEAAAAKGELGTTPPEHMPIQYLTDTQIHERLQDIEAAYKRGGIDHQDYTDLRAEVEQEMRRRINHAEWNNASDADLKSAMRGLSNEELKNVIDTVDINAHRRLQKAAEAEWHDRATIRQQPVVKEAERVAGEATTAREETAAAQRYRQRPVREATEAARAEQTFGPMVRDTMGEQGGATYDIRTGEPVPYEGHMVGGFAPTEKVRADLFGSGDIAAFIRKNQNVFLDDPDVKVGTERVKHGGIEYVNIDAVKSIADRDEALRVAKENGEQRIWDTSTDSAIKVPGVKQTERNVHDFLAGDKGALDFKKLGEVAKSVIGSAADSIVRVTRAIVSLAREFHSNELGAILTGRKTFESLKPDDILNFGAARRWLFPGEDWQTWAQDMTKRVGGSEEFWINRKADILSHTEKMSGLLGEGKQGVTEKGVPFGREAGPSTMERLQQLADDGRRVHQGGNRVDMMKWYNNFWKTMQQHFGDDAEVMTKLMAITQQNNAPAGGVPLAMRAYLQWKMGEPISRMGSKTIREQMESVLMGGMPKGEKITPFYNALRYNNALGRNSVAVDRWVILAEGAKARGAGGDVKFLQGNKQFVRFSQALIASAADEAGIAPRAFQAAIWGGFRTEWDRLLKAAGGKPMGGDNNYFENLLIDRFKQYRLRSPADFRLNTPDGFQRSLFDASADADREIEFWQKQRLETLARNLNQSPEKADQIMQDMMYAEWNKKIAAARMLDTGEIPSHLKTQEVIDDVRRTAQQYRDQFRSRIQFADDATLKSLKDIPEWQKREVAGELDQRKRIGEAVTAAWSSLPKDERTRLTTLGWMNVPRDPRIEARTSALLQDLDKVQTEADLVKWMNRPGVENIVGDKNQFIGKMNRTGETYVDNKGATVQKTAPSPYWEARPFYENRYVLNVDKVKEAIRARFPDTDPNNARPGARALGIIDKADEGLGPCGVSAAEAAF